MKTLSAFLLLAVSSNALAATPQCWVNNDGNHYDLSVDTAEIDTGAPFGKVQILSINRNRMMLKYTFEGTKTIVFFNNKISLEKSSATERKFIGNIVCI